MAEICRLWMNSVWPSGAARATRWPAMLVPPPLTFSTMKFWPNFAGEFRRELPRHLIGRPAGRVGHDDGDGARRIGLREGAGAECNQQSSKGKTQ